MTVYNLTLKMVNFSFISLTQYRIKSRWGPAFQLRKVACNYKRLMMDVVLSIIYFPEVRKRRRVRNMILIFIFYTQVFKLEYYILKK